MGEARLERRLTAILAADVAGYCRLMGIDEEATLAELKACRREVIDPKIAEHRGRIVKTTGDGALAELSAPSMRHDARSKFNSPWPSVMLLFPKTKGSNFASVLMSATSSLMKAIFTETASTSPLASRLWPAPARSALPRMPISRSRAS